MNYCLLPFCYGGHRDHFVRVQPMSDFQNDIAVIGLSGRFPGADGIEAFWKNLRDGVESIGPISEDELRRAGIDRSIFEKREYVPVNAPLAGVELFDAAFFGMTPREAAMIDPQQRVFLECAWETLEMAGYDPEQFPGRIGVFAGAGMNTYLLRNVLSNPDVIDPESHFSIAIANDKDYLTTRVAYKLNLKGPAITVQTACSTSLVAVHMGCQSLLNGECEMVLAGGVAVRVPQSEGYVFYDGGIASPDGHCRAFDADARGTVFGSGVGIVLLKPLAAAQADGDTIYAVIKGSAVNNDGSLKAGFTAPNVDRQAEVIAEAQVIGDVAAESIGYVEAHGTATPMGDPIEVTALTRAFRLGTSEKRFCGIGSVKTNVGHLDTAAGVTGLIKTILALRHRQIPPSLHFKSSNPQIDFESSPFFVCDRLTDWPMRGTPRRAGVSSFGIGGTNAHVVLEEGAAVKGAASQPWQLLLLSARTATALEAATTRLAEHLQQHDDVNLADVTYTTQLGRRAFDHRRFLVCEDLADARTAITGAQPGRQISGTRAGGERRIVFMFPGQGSQYVRMGWDLYQSEPTFRDEVDACAQILQPHLGLDLRSVIYPDDAHIDEMTRKLDETRIAQPAIFVVSYALAKLWMKWSVRPGAMIGHSIGEYVAACIAGVFSRDDALALLAARGRMMQDLPRGAMLAVSLSEEEVRKHLSGRLSLAAVNGAERCVVSGRNDDILELEKRLSAAGAGCRRLHTSHAFHSEMMEPILEQFEKRVAQVQMLAPEIPCLSNLTGDWITPEQATNANYWSRHLRETVRFADGLGRVMSEPETVLLEVGPSRTLSSLAMQNASRSPKQIILHSTRHSHDVQSDRAFLLTTIGRLWTCGVEIDWPAFWGNERRLRVPLPTYPFERQRHWIEPGAVHAPKRAASSLEDWFYIPSWKRAVIPKPFDRREHTSGSWLLFLDETGIGAAIAERLTAAGDTVTTARAGGTFSKSGARTYIINPAQADDYAKLLGELAHEDHSLTHIVHLWNLGNDEQATAMTLGFFSLLALARAIGRETQKRCHLYVVSSGVHAVTGAEELQSIKATILGACKVMPREYSYLKCVNIDVEPEVHRERLADQLLAECSTEPSEATVAYRGPHRWIQTFERLSLPEVEAGRLRTGGTYLITGGLGGLGLEFAEMLARTCRAKLILLGRSEFPPRDGWDTRLTTHTDSDVSRIIRRLRQIEAAGGELLVIKADVTDRHALQAAIDCGRARFGHIDGVIHAAGIAGGGMMQWRTAEECRAVLAPKIDGARHLRDLFKENPPELFVLCSSIEAIRGSFGQADYCAANCFLDAFADESTYHHNMPMVSINWDRWRETGMAASSKVDKRHQSDHPLLGKRIAEQLFEAVLRPEEQWVLNEHRIFAGIGVMPGTAYLEMARAAFLNGNGTQAINVSDVLFVNPLAIPDGQVREVRTTLRDSADGTQFSIRSRDPNVGADSWQDHAFGRLTGAVVDLSSKWQAAKKVEELIRELDLKETAVTSTQREQIRHHGLGPRWDTVKQVFAGPNDIIALIELPQPYAGDLASFGLHPALLDTAVGYANWHVGGDGTFLPVSYAAIGVHAELPARFYSHVRFDKGEGAREAIRYNVTLMNPEGAALVEIDGLVFQRVHSMVPATPHPPAERTRSRQLLGEGMSPVDGVEALRRIMARGIVSQVIVSMKDPARVMEEAGSAEDMNLLNAIGSLAQPVGSAPLARPNLRCDYAAPKDGIETQLAKIWADLLGVERVGRDDNFFELGGDSVVAIQMIAKARHVGMKLTPQLLFRRQTIAELAAGGEDINAPGAEAIAPPSGPAQAFALAGLSDEAMKSLARQVELADE